MKLKGPTSDDIGLMGDVFTEAAWNAINRVLDKTASGLHGVVTVDDLTLVKSHWTREVDSLIDFVQQSYDLGSGITRINQHEAIVQHLGLTAAAGEPVGAGDDSFKIPKVHNPQVDTFLANARNRLVGVGNDVWGAARSQLLEGIQAGEGLPALRQRVVESANVSGSRAEVIARSETGHAMNQGSLDQMKMLTNVQTMKEWIAVNDDRTRPEHAEVDGEQVPLDSVFSTGDDPGDEPNCRCTLGFDIADDDTITTDVQTGEPISSQDSFVQQACGCTSPVGVGLSASALITFAGYDPAYAKAYREKQKAKRAAEKAAAEGYVPPPVAAPAKKFLDDTAAESTALESPCACAGISSDTSLVTDRFATLSPGQNARYDLSGNAGFRADALTAENLKYAGITNSAYRTRILNLNKVLEERFGYHFTSAENAASAMYGKPGYEVIAYVRDGNYLGVNGNELIDKFIRADEKSGWLQHGSGGIEDTLVHEFGHVLMRPAGGWVPASREYSRAVSAANSAARAAGAPQGLHVSDYAKESAGERDAELWANYNMGGTRRPDWVVKWGETFMRELGLDPTPLCVDLGRCP
jgi:SPP1 gp7 family putative phage head morphogenesis protein